MKRRLFFAAGLMIPVLLCTASVTQGAGQNARLGALGVDGDLLEDPLNVGVYPSNTTFWTNLVTVDVGEGELVQHALWGAWRMKGLGALGLGFVGKQNNRQPETSGPSVGNVFSLYWGGDLSKSAGIGVVLDYSVARRGSDTEHTVGSGTTGRDDDANSSTIGARAGLHMSLGPFRRVHLSAGYEKHSWDHFHEVIRGGASNELDDLDMSTENLDLNLRAFSHGSGPVTFVPSVHLEFGSRDGEQSLLRGSDLDDGKEIDYGGDGSSYSGQLGVQVEVGKKTNIYASIGGRYATVDTDEFGQGIDSGEVDLFEHNTTLVEIRETDFPRAAIGVESVVRDWLTLRFGASKIQRRSTRETMMGEREGDVTRMDRETREEYLSRLNIASGFALQIGNLTLDAVLNNDFLYEGGYIVSGVRRTPMTEVSMTYTFD